MKSFLRENENEIASKITTWPHSVHSDKAASSLEIVSSSNSKSSGLLLVSLISVREAIALAATIGFESPTMSCRISMKP